MQTICHLTSVHPPFDIRIFHKQCVSLKDRRYNVKLIAPGFKKEIRNGVEVLPIHLPQKRLKRMLVVSLRMYRSALTAGAELYHFHDPELLLCGILLKISGKKVIFDIHENVRLSFASKSWLPKPLVPIIRFLYYIIERLSFFFFDGLVLAEESYEKYYPGQKSTTVLNYPILKDKESGMLNQEVSDSINLVYAGGISENRGIWEMLNLLKELNKANVNAKLNLVGKVYSPDLLEQIQKFIADNNIKNEIRLTGQIPYYQVKEILKQSHVGLALLKPIPNYKESLPTKIFEYMQYGLPVITNNFPLYKRYVEVDKSGICVDITNFNNEIQNIINLLSDEEKWQELGLNGLESIEKYNWENEADKLWALYKKLLS